MWAGSCASGMDDTDDVDGMDGKLSASGVSYGVSYAFFNCSRIGRGLGGSGRATCLQFAGGIRPTGGVSYHA